MTGLSNMVLGVLLVKNLQKKLELTCLIIPWDRYHDSYGAVFYTGKNLVSKIYAPASYKRRKLLGLVRDLRQRVETLCPDALMKVNDMISGEESLNSESEID